MAKKPIPLPVLVEEAPPPEEKKCPPVGAPAWMATFADIATLLMAFFVLILSFAEFNQPKFKMVAGSLKESFGVQRQVPVMHQPKGTTLMKLEFSPSPDMAVIKQPTQDTTDTTKPEIQKPDEERNDFEGGQADGDQTGEGQGESSELAEALEDALGSGNVSAEARDGQVVLTFDAADSDAEALAEQLNEAAQAMAEAAQTTGQNTSEVLMDGLAEALPEMAEALGQKVSRSEGQGSEADAASEAARRAALAEAKLRVAMRREVGEGLVTVEQREGKVFVTVGAGGAFPSGDADLTDEARDIMGRIAFSAMSDASTITVTGHTDDVPVNPASSFRDNWGLAAPRASSVVRELSASGLIDGDRLTAISRGESKPIADNTTAAGREKNRRIEIEIDYEVSP